MANLRRDELIDDLLLLLIIVVMAASAFMYIDYATSKPYREPENWECWSILHDDFPVPPFTAEDCMP